MGCAQRPRKGWMGRQQRRKKGSRQYSVGTGQAAGRQTEEKKGGWEGGESPGRRPAALGGHRRHGAGGPGAGCAKAEGTRGGATRGLTMARRREVSDSRAGGRGGSATASLPALSLAGSGCRTARTAAGALPARSLAGSLARAPRPRGPAREDRDGRLHRPAQPGTPAETPPPSQASPPLL